MLERLGLGFELHGIKRDKSWELLLLLGLDSDVRCHNHFSRFLPHMLQARTAYDRKVQMHGGALALER